MIMKVTIKDNVMYPSDPSRTAMNAVIKARKALRRGDLTTAGSQLEKALQGFKDVFPCGFGNGTQGVILSAYYEKYKGLKEWYDRSSLASQ